MRRRKLSERRLHVARGTALCAIEEEVDRMTLAQGCDFLRELIDDLELKIDVIEVSLRSQARRALP